MNPQDVIERIWAEFEGLVSKASWGETAIFYNPEKRLPNGVYFCTIKEKDGQNDQASQLDRSGIFRVSIKLAPRHYQALFGDKPARPPKGGVVSTGHDFAQLNLLMPHPIYAWMSWAQILSPSRDRFEKILPYMRESYQLAQATFNRNTVNH